MDRPRIVIADDDDDLRDLLRESFVAAGYEVDEAVDGNELRLILEAAEVSGKSPDLILSDHRMPFATGLEVLSWASRHVPGVPFLLFSAFAAPHVRQRALQLGAAAVLEKPIDLRVLKQTVAAILDGHSKQARS